jgi:hypothetical protein
MLVRDAIPPDVAEQPPKAAQNNNKRTARNIVTLTYMHTMPNSGYNSLNSALWQADLDSDSVNMMIISLNKESLGVPGR